MHNPRPLERTVGRPSSERKPGLLGFCSLLPPPRRIVAYAPNPPLRVNFTLTSIISMFRLFDMLIGARMKNIESYRNYLGHFHNQ